MTRPVVDLVRWFRSVKRPELDAFPMRNEDGDEEVWPCDFCKGTGIQEIRSWGHGDSYLDGERECEECDGHGWLHGYDDRGYPCPAYEVDPPRSAA